MVVKKLKYIELSWNPEIKKLYLIGHNKFVEGEIMISYFYLYSIFCFISRIFRMRKK